MEELKLTSLQKHPALNNFSECTLFLAPGAERIVIESVISGTHPLENVLLIAGDLNFFIGPESVSYYPEIEEDEGMRKFFEEAVAPFSELLNSALMQLTHGEFLQSLTWRGVTRRLCLISRALLLVMGTILCIGLLHSVYRLTVIDAGPFTEAICFPCSCRALEIDGQSEDTSKMARTMRSIIGTWVKLRLSYNPTSRGTDIGSVPQHP
jgi:hypothetical protein